MWNFAEREVRGIHGAISLNVHTWNSSKFKEQKNSSKNKTTYFYQGDLESSMKIILEHQKGGLENSEKKNTKKTHGKNKKLSQGSSHEKAKKSRRSHIKVRIQKLSKFHKKNLRSSRVYNLDVHKKIWAKFKEEK